MLNNQKGQALILVLLMTTIIFLVGGAALTMGTTVRKTAVHEINQNKAYYIAEAGVEKVLAKAKNDSDWAKSRPQRSDFDGNKDEIFIEYEKYPASTSDGEIEEVRVIKTGEDTAKNEVTLKIKSKGKYSKNSSNQSKRTLIVSATLKYLKNVFKNTVIYSENNLDMGKRLDVTGNIYCRGNVKLTTQGGQASQVKGNIYALGGVSGEGTITGTVYVDNPSKVTVTPLPTYIVLDSAYLSSLMPVEEDITTGMLSQDKLNWYKDNADFYALPPSMIFGKGVYYIDSSISLSGTYTGSAVIVVNGNISITGDLVRMNNNTDYCLTILATGKIETPEAANKEIDALLYANEEVIFKNKIDLKGSVISKNVVAPWAEHGHIGDIYNNDMIERFDEITKMICFVKINSWKE